AISMATGEYTSVASQTELARAEIRVEQREIEARPRAEMRELAMLYERRGVDRETAHRVAEQLSRDPDQVWRGRARGGLGVGPAPLPSPWPAAFSSFLSFTVGAFVPLLPYLLGMSSLPFAAVLALAGLFVAGVITSRFTSRSWWYSGARQALLGALAAIV